MYIMYYLKFLQPLNVEPLKFFLCTSNFLRAKTFNLLKDKHTYISTNYFMIHVVRVFLSTKLYTCHELEFLGFPFVYILCMKLFFQRKENFSMLNTCHELEFFSFSFCVNIVYEIVLLDKGKFSMLNKRTDLENVTLICLHYSFCSIDRVSRCMWIN